MVADALIYHPTVSHYLRYVATTVGRDKLLRTLQYFSRFLAWYLYRTNHPKSSIQPWETLKKQFGTTRKLMRVGKFVEHFRAAAVAADAKNMDPVLRYFAVGRQLGYAGYLTLDNLTILDATAIRKFDSAKKLSREAYRFWFTGLSFSIASGLYSLFQLRQRAARLKDSKEGEEVVESKKLAKEHSAIRKQLISDCCDICAPSTALGFVNLDEGVIGLAGTVSSLIGVYSAWKKTA